MLNSQVLNIAMSEQNNKNEKSALIEKNSVEYVRINDDRGIGIRIIKDNVWNFCSITNPKTFEQIKDAIDNSIKSNKINKKNGIKLHPNTAKKAQVNYLVIKKPELEDIIEIGLEADEIISGIPKIIKSIVNPWFTINSKYFVNTEGSEIMQNFTDTVIDMVATAHNSGITQSVNITEGGRGGLEQLTIKNKIQQMCKRNCIKSITINTCKTSKRRECNSSNEPRLCIITYT